MSPHHRLPVAGGAAPAAREEPGLRPHADRHYLLAGVWLRRRWLSSSGDEQLCAWMGRDAAAALVHPDPVRPGRARRACARLRGAFHHARQFGDSLLRPLLGPAHCTGAPSSPRACAGAAGQPGGQTRHRRGIRRRVRTRAGQQGRFRTDRARPHYLRGLVSSTLYRAADQGRACRSRRRRQFGREPLDNPGYRCRRGDGGRIAADDPGGSANGAGAARGVRHSRDTCRHRARGAERR